MAVIFGVLLILLVAAPFMFPYGTFLDLDGSPSVMDHDWSSYGAGGLLYAFGDLICHQEQSRTFILNGSEMPVCIRDTGLLMGFVSGLVGNIFLQGYLREKWTLYIGFALLVPTAIEWAAESVTHADLPEIRFVLAIISGIGAAMVVGYALFLNSENTR